MSTKHTPTPWFIGMRGGYNASQIYARDGKGEIAEHKDTTVCQVYGIPLNTVKEDAEQSRHPQTKQGMANAAFIVQACNAHEELVEALTNLVASCTPARLPSDQKFHGVKSPDKGILEAARAILAKVGNEPSKP